MKINIVKQLNNTFKVAYDSDFEKLKKIKAGVPYEVDIKNRRNAKFHRKFFALINLVFQNQDTYNVIDELRKDLTIASGFYTQHKTFTGQIRTEAVSIAFHKMDEIEFSELYNKFLDTIEKYFHFDKESVNENINNFY